MFTMDGHTNVKYALKTWKYERIYKNQSSYAHRKWIHRWKVNTVCYTHWVTAVVCLSFLQHQTEFFSVFGVILRCYIKYTGRDSSTVCPWILEAHRNFKAPSAVLCRTRSMWRCPLHEMASLSGAEEFWRERLHCFHWHTKSSDNKQCWWHFAHHNLCQIDSHEIEPTPPRAESGD